MKKKELTLMTSRLPFCIKSPQGGTIKENVACRASNFDLAGRLFFFERDFLKKSPSSSLQNF